MSYTGGFIQEKYQRKHKLQSVLYDISVSVIIVTIQ